MNRDELIKNGINYDEGLERFCGAAELYEKFLKKFIADGTFGELERAMEAGDYAAAFSAAHTLKGVSGNLSLTRLYNETLPFVEMLRNDKDTAGARAAFPKLQNCYREVIDVLERI